MTEPPPRIWARLPFYAGWLIVAIAFVTMAVSVTTRTAFSLLLPPLLDEFGWSRGAVAGAFSFGFLASALVSPPVGRSIDRRGPRPVILLGAVLMGAGLLLAPLIAAPWQLYATLGMLVGVGVNLTAYLVQSLYLPNWFVRRRALAIGIAFSGVGVGAVVLLPWLQTVIETAGWRAACTALGLVVLLGVIPLNLLVRHRPQDVGLLPDGAAAPPPGSVPVADARIADADWTTIEWTLARAVRTRRFWWLALGYFCALVAWYSVQVHQTAYLVEVGFPPLTAAWALGIVPVVAIPGQIGLGALADRIGREWIWAIGCAGFALCYATLIALAGRPDPALLALMVVAQGGIGYALVSVMGPIVVEIFEGPHYGAIFGTLNVAMISGGAFGPWVAGAIYDATGSYSPAFALAIVCCAVSALAVWRAAPRQVRRVPGRVPRG